MLSLHAMLFTLASIGVSETAYLIRKRRADERPFCPIGEGCHTVLSSKYAKLFGVPNDVLGFLFYIAMAIVASFLVLSVEPLSFWLIIGKISLSMGTLLSLILLYIQWRVLKTWCFWCVMSACTTFIMNGIIFLV